MSSTDDVPMVDTSAGELLVWPWTGVLATTAAAHDKDNTAVSLLSSHARHHPAAVATTALVQDAAPTDTHCRKHHFLVLHFGKSLSGLRAASSLAGRFAGAGRTEWHLQQQRHGENAYPGAVAVYGWTAMEEDLRREDALGRFLSATVAITRSAEDAVAVEHEKAARLLEARCEEAAAALLAAQEEKNLLRQELAGWRTIADKIVEMNRKVEEENRMLNAALEKVTKDIESKMEKIGQLEDLEKCTLDINTLELTPAGGGCKLGDHALMLQANHKEEMEAIRSKLIQLEEQLEQREALVLMTRQLNMKLEAGENLTKEDHPHLYAVMVYLKEELERLTASWLDLYKRDEMNRKELQENRQVLIQSMENMLISGRVTVGIKRMGQLDERPFHIACKWKYKDNDPEGKAANLVSSWQEEIQKPSWHPFTTIKVDGEDKTVVDDNDSKLRQLRLECGDSVCCEVKAALSEINEYSPHGRHVVNEIWNFPEGRKATMTEAITYILEQLTVADPVLGGCEFKAPPIKRSTSI